MKTENLYIECQNLEQRDEILNILTKNGCREIAPRKIFRPNVLVYDDGGFRSTRLSKYGASWFIERSFLTYTQFMEKYAMQKFKEAVAKAKDKFNVDNTGLSRMLGYHRDYINEALKDGRSTKWQEKTIAKIEGLSKGVVLDKITVEIDAKVSPELQKIINDTKAEIENVSKENTQLKKDKEQLVIHNAKLVEEIAQANAIYSGLKNDKSDLVKKLSDSQIKKNDLAIEFDKYKSIFGFKSSERDVLKGQIVSLEKINARYKNKYAASVTIGIMIASVLICVILWGGK